MVFESISSDADNKDFHITNMMAQNDEQQMITRNR